MMRLHICFLVCAICSALYFPSLVEGSESPTSTTTGTILNPVTAPPSSASGRRITAKRESPYKYFRTITTLGEGSYGVTYKVADNKGRHFALKVSHDSDCLDRGFKKEAMNEYRIGREMRHINIVRARAFFLWSNKCAILMDLASGDSILQVWRKALPQSKLRKELDKNNHAQVWDIVFKIASGIERLCENNIVHGDLSQNNVMFDEVSKQVTIIDLGAATKAPHDNYYRKLTETCMIRSPERRHKGITVGPPQCSADVFALCSIATYLLGNPIIQIDAGDCVYDRYDRLAEESKAKSETEIIGAFVHLFHEQSISIGEALLLKNMCHWDVDKRINPADLVKQLDAYLKNESPDSKKDNGVSSLLNKQTDEKK